MNDFWGAVMIFIAANWWWVLPIFFTVVGSIMEFFGDTFSTLFKHLGQRRGLKSQIKDLKRQLKAKDAELSRAHKLLEGGRPVGALPSGSEPRMARLLDRVQATDSAVPQLPLNLREEIDAELKRFYAIDDKEKS
jgi:hypothetical protein